MDMKEVLMAKKYVRVSEGLNHYKLVEKPLVDAAIKSNDKDYYTSIFLYDQKHYDQWMSTKSLAGVKDVVTNRLFFDFDNDADLEAAQKDATTLVERLIEDGINPNNIQCAFSGSKGFSVEVEHTSMLTPQQFKNIVFSYAADLRTFDTVVNDPNRIVRVTGTKHQKSSLYKYPLTPEELSSLTIDEILNLAKDINNANSDYSGWVEINLPETVTRRAYKETKPEAKVIDTVFEQSVEHLDWNKKPRWLSNCKFAIMNGFVPTGQRNNALMALASTFKAQGFSEEHTMAALKATTVKISEISGEEEFPEHELKRNVVGYVFGPSWKGGAYTCREEGWLKNYCDSLGHHKCQHESRVLVESPKTLLDITPKFKDFVKNIENNTIKTGIPTLDKHLFITTGMPLAIVGAPGSGKTSLALEILNNTSKAGVGSVFASLDMTATRIYEKLAYRLTGKSRAEIYSMFKEDREHEYLELLREEFGNSFFYDKSSPTVKDLRDYIIACEQESGNKIKLVVIDYFERIFSEQSDDTAASKRVASELQDMVNDLGVCMITLLQPNKMSGDLSEPISSYTNIKGSSFIAQSMRMILSVYREGFDPRVPENDRFLTVNVLKNDLGETASFDFNWYGKRGFIQEMDFEDLALLEEIRNRKALEKIKL